jgi:hypothetical protein
MSEKAISWCGERGQYIKLPVEFAQVKEIDPIHLEVWQRTQDDRVAWFKKPFACLHSPYLESIWIDLDCEIRGSLEPLFNILALGADLAMAQDLIELLRKPCPSFFTEYMIYNAGVMPFRRDARVISRWVEETMHRSGDFFSDQDLLSWLIHEVEPSFFELSSIYNWNAALGPNPQAVMIHYVASHKSEIAEKLGSC